MICTWKHEGPTVNHVIQFDADIKADEMRKLREFAKKHGYKIKDMKREDSNG